MLKGIDLSRPSAPDFFLEDTSTAVLVRQVLGAIAQFEKASLVAKLKAARDRKRARDGKCEGRQSHREMNPQLVAMAKRLRPSAQEGQAKIFTGDCPRACSAWARERQWAPVCSEINPSNDPATL
jgi:DNA invertase Pin-like site-specific DNA recombinase